MNADGSAATPGGHNMTTGLTEKCQLVTALPPGISFAALKTAIQGVYEQGGEVTHFMSNPGVIGALSTYMFDNEARVATLTSDQGAPANSKATALSSVNVLVSDFGTIKLVPNRLQPLDENDNAIGFLLDPEYVSLSYLEGYRTDTLAKTGLAEKRQISVDWGLRVHTEKAHGMIVNIDPAAEATA